MSIPSDLAARLRELISTPLPEISGVAPVRKVQADLVPGQRVSAEILNPQQDGNYRAIVAGRTLTLSLPQSVKSGDVLELIVSRSTPQVTEARLAEPPAQATPRPVLSSTAQIVSQLMSGRLGEPEAAPLQSGKPLVPGTGVQAQTLSPALKQSIEQSGVFYEAHQARWVAGSLPLDQLLQEPQARIGLLAREKLEGSTPLPGQAKPVESGQASAEADVPVRSNTPPQTPTNVPERSAGATGASGAAASASAETKGSLQLTDFVPKEMSKLVHQQLDSLVTQQLAWQGQVWPGQTMNWSIEVPQRQGGSSADTPEAQVWKTRLSLQLPKLGGVDTQLVLTQAGLALRMEADSDAVAAQLGEHFAELQSALEAAGISITGHSIAATGNG